MSLRRVQGYSGGWHGCLCCNLFSYQDLLKLPHGDFTTAPIYNTIKFYGSQWSKWQDWLSTACACCTVLTCSEVHQKLTEFCITWYMAQNSILKCVISFLQNLERLSRICVPFLVVGNVGCNNLFFYWKDILSFSRPLGPPKFIDGAGPWLCKFYLPQSKMHTSYQGLQCTFHFLLTQFKEHDVMIYWINVMFCSMFRLSRYLQTILR